MKEWVIEKWDTTGVIIATLRFNTLEEACSKKEALQFMDLNANHIYVIKKEKE